MMSRLALAAAGPIAVGAVLSARLGTLAPVIALPAIILGVTAVTAPALYIATAATGTAPPAQHMITALGRGLTALGIALLGLLAPLAFLLATSMTEGTWVGLGTLALAAGTLIGLASLHRALFEHRLASVSRDALFAGWSLAAILIGTRFYLDVALGVS
jgi:hypothetical protein